ncbi:Predicted PurR-regulated permease PerM [Tessaracoccus bendigoensis DSM 12906]|uniref:Predicted PurR-regulated permease PerM n=1 Tax=Tessaracoccus bendigoensis DSM 12906 TaxID=1123357 RepID=A0A1M6D526_9ACTN|nr:AI-2E family transporter [Tessaracoccus bendigoensis]SHI68203.1 Predicted PurR-regulated permease PerM [Tessaracoccus bendigoensis DSM 12906]
MGTESTTPPPRRSRIAAVIDRPFVLGFLAVAGGLTAIALGGALVSLSGVLVSLGVALFVALALEPLVRWLERHRMSRGLAMAVVFAAFAVVMAALVSIVVPVAVTQIVEFAGAVPGYLTSMQDADWFKNLVSATGQGDLYSSVLGNLRSWLANPNNIFALGGGALAVGTGVVNGVSTTLIVIVLTLYFIAALESMKRGFVSLAPAHSRARLRRITDQIADSVGGYVSGMAILAACNAVLTFILLSILGVPFAPLLAVLALFVTMIPMIGSVVFWIIASLVSLLSIGWVGFVFVGVYFAYMQVEAYVMCPRVMSKAVSVPGILVLIGAMVGGTLLGLLGALVAVPVTASLLMILNEVWIPKQDAKLEAPVEQ